MDTLVFDSSFVAVGNGYVCAVVDLVSPRLSVLRGDFLGRGRYGKNVLVDVTLEVEDAAGQVHSSAAAGAASARVTQKSPQSVSVSIDGIRDRHEAAVVESWNLTLAAGARSLELWISGSTQHAFIAKAVRHTFRFQPTSMYGLFDGGVVQMKGQELGRGYYFSDDGLSRLYALGGAGGDLDTAGNMSVAVRRASVGTAVLMSSNVNPYSGFADVVLSGASSVKNEWCEGWGLVAAVRIEGQLSWRTWFELAPNDRDFPVQGPDGDLTTMPNVPAEDLQALLTGIYASTVGQLVTQIGGVEPGVRVAQMATTIARPDYGYANTFSFFDPDNYFSTAALLFSGDYYLQEQVRLVLEHTGNFMQPGGQLPHHFVGVEPVYRALSNELQTGPNVFWILSCFNYVKTTGNIAWLRAYLPKLRQASAFLHDLIDTNVGLLRTRGSLMIDVFIRHNFTADTNAMMVGFLQEFAEAERAVGNATGAVRLECVAASLARQMDLLLWNRLEDDHYVTQLNPDGSSTDFVDYDANLIALAHGIAPQDRAFRLLGRIDGGRCAHGRATFVSERYYGLSATTHGNIGDSWCAMGRVGWFDALARKRYRDQVTFDTLLLDPLVRDVNRWTWLHERYGCDGLPQTNRTAMYFEYPAVTAMMLHFVRYGIQLGISRVLISPFGPTSFSYHVGSVHVEFAETLTMLSVPGQGTRHIAVEGLRAGAPFRVTVGDESNGPPLPLAPAAWPRSRCRQSAGGTVWSSPGGRVDFLAVVGDEAGPCIIKIFVTAAGGEAAVL